MLSQSPNNARAHNLMCRVEVQTKRGAQGIAECERALALNPNLAAARAQTGLAKLFDGHPEETEGHELEALRVSPHDTEAGMLGSLHRHRQAASWRLRGGARLVSPVEGTEPKLCHWTFRYGCCSGGVGRLDEARAEVQAGLALNPGFTIRRYRAGATSDNPVYLKRRERIIEDMRKAGVPEG